MPHDLPCSPEFVVRFNCSYSPSGFILQCDLYRTAEWFPARLDVPSSTDARIEELCARIRVLCCDSFTAETERELKTLARDLKLAIREHVRAARSSLSTKKSAIMARDPDAK